MSLSFLSLRAEGPPMVDQRPIAKAPTSAASDTTALARSIRAFLPLVNDAARPVLKRRRLSSSSTSSYSRNWDRAWDPALDRDCVS